MNQQLLNKFDEKSDKIFLQVKENIDLNEEEFNEIFLQIKEFFGEFKTDPELNNLNILDEWDKFLEENE